MHIMEKTLVSAIIRYRFPQQKVIKEIAFYELKDHLFCSAVFTSGTILFDAFSQFIYFCLKLVHIIHNSVSFQI